MPVPAIQGDTFAPAFQVIERAHMGLGKVADVNEVAHTGTVSGIIVIAENSHLRPPAYSDLAGHLDQVGCAGGRLSRAAKTIRSCDVEVPQDYIAQSVRPLRIPQHPFYHKFGGAIGAFRPGRRVLYHRNPVWLAIHSSSRG